MQSRILHGDCREVLRDLPAKSVHCVVTSPPYWGLRSYGGDEGMIGLEPTFEEHLVNLVAVFREVRRVLRDDGTLWLNYGDAYTSIGRSPKKESPGVGAKQAMPRVERDVIWKAGGGHDFSWTLPGGFKPKDLMMMPARVAMALQADGWYLRSKIIWGKPNPMPESATDRPTSAYEELFLLTKKRVYFYDAAAVRTPISEDSATRRGRADYYEREVPPGMQLQGGLSGQYSKPYDPGAGKDFTDSGAQDARSTKARIVEGVRNGTITGANLRNVWTIATNSYKGAHFATFPPALVEPCIKAGTSERGVCGECGAPWKRQISKEVVKNRPSAGNDQRSRGEDKLNAESKHGHKGNNLQTKFTTTGWAPTCEHYDELYREMSRQPRRVRKRQQRAAWPGRWQRVRARPGSGKWEAVPATVCDPFAGSGTAGEVALSLGRSFVGVEINAEYVAMGTRRTDTVAPLFRER